MASSSVMAPPPCVWRRGVLRVPRCRARSSLSALWLGPAGRVTVLTRTAPASARARGSTARRAACQRRPMVAVSVKQASATASRRGRLAQAAETVWTGRPFLPMAGDEHEVADATGARAAGPPRRRSLRRVMSSISKLSTRPSSTRPVRLRRARTRSRARCSGYPEFRACRRRCRCLQATRRRRAPTRRDKMTENRRAGRRDTLSADAVVAPGEALQQPRRGRRRHRQQAVARAHEAAAQRQGARRSSAHPRAPRRCCPPPPRPSANPSRRSRGNAPRPPARGGSRLRPPPGGAEIARRVRGTCRA